MASTIDQFLDEPSAGLDAVKKKEQTDKVDSFLDQPAAPKASDYGKALARGTVNLLTTSPGAGLEITGRKAEKAGYETVGRGVQTVGKALRDMGRRGEEAITESMSEGGQQPTTFPQKVGMAVAESAPSMVATYGIAAPLTKAAEGLEVARKVSRAAKALGTSEETAAAVGKGAQYAAPAAAAEGAIAGFQNAAQSGDEVRSMPESDLIHTPAFRTALASTDRSLPFEQRMKLAREKVAQDVEGSVAAVTAPTTAVTGLVAGGGAVGQLLERAAGKGAGATIRSAATKEAAQEFVQSGAEQAAQNVVAQDTYAPERALSDGVLEQALVGGAAGGVLGGGAGVAETVLGPREQAPERRPQAREAPVVTPDTVEAAGPELAPAYAPAPSRRPSRTPRSVRLDTSAEFTPEGPRPLTQREQAATYGLDSLFRGNTAGELMERPTQAVPRVTEGELLDRPAELGVDREALPGRVFENVAGELPAPDARLTADVDAFLDAPESPQLPPGSPKTAPALPAPGKEPTGQSVTSEAKAPRTEPPPELVAQVQALTKEGKPHVAVESEPGTFVALPAPDGQTSPTALTFAEYQDRLRAATSVARAAHQAATSPHNDLPQPTDAQKEAGNYQKGHLKWAGLDISIENPKGSERTGTDKGGKPWSVTMPAHYGYIRRTNGNDGEQVDVYVGDHLKDDGPVFIVDQLHADTKAFDEHKVILGARNGMEAKKLYRDGFSDGKGKERMGAVSQLTPEQFKEWLKNGDTKVPYDKKLQTAATAAMARQEALAQLKKLLMPYVDRDATIEQVGMTGTAGIDIRNGKATVKHKGESYTFKLSDHWEAWRKESMAEGRFESRQARAERETKEALEKFKVGDYIQSHEVILNKASGEGTAYTSGLIFRVKEIRGDQFVGEPVGKNVSNVPDVLIPAVSAHEVPANYLDNALNWKQKEAGREQAFAENREALKHFKVGERVQWFRGGQYSNADDTKSNGRMFSGYIVKIEDKLQGWVGVASEPGGKKATESVPGRILEHYDPTYHDGPWLGQTMEHWYSIRSEILKARNQAASDEAKQRANRALQAFRDAQEHAQRGEPELASNALAFASLQLRQRWGAIAELLDAMINEVQATAEGKATTETTDERVPKTEKTDETKKAEPTKKQARDAERTIFTQAVKSDVVLGAAGAADAAAFKKEVDPAIANAIRDLLKDATPEQEVALNAVLDGDTVKLSPAFYASLLRQAKRLADQVAKEKNRDPLVYQTAVYDAFVASKLDDDAPIAKAFKEGFDHALRGQPRSTLTGEMMDVRDLGFKAGRRWRITKDGRAWYEGKRLEKDTGTGEALRRWWDGTKKSLDKLDEDDPEKFWASLKSITSRAEAFPNLLPEGATPGAITLLNKARGEVSTFGDYLYYRLTGFTPSRRRRAASTPKQVKLLNGEHYGLHGADGPAFEAAEDVAARMALFKDYARDYLDALRDLSEQFKDKRTLEEVHAVTRRVFGDKNTEGSLKKDNPALAAGADWRTLRLLTDEKSVDYEYLKKREADAALVAKAERSEPLRRPKMDKVVREGVEDYRKGKPLTSADLKKIFGFADITIGEYVKAEEAVDHMNYAHDALRDLADLLGAKPTALSFGGKLHFAVGALGHGRHSAHYQDEHPTGDGRVVPVINITNKRGDGSVAHEMFHAIDFNTADNETKRAVQALKNLLKYKPRKPEEVMEIVRRFAVGGWSFRGERNASAKEKVRRALQWYKYHETGTQTDFYKAALKLGADYWGNEFEPWARAGESFIYDTLLNSQKRSDYLVNGWVADGYIKPPTHRGTPYPMGEERKEFNRLFAEFFQQLEWTEKGPRLKDDAPWRKLDPDTAADRAWEAAIDDALKNIDALVKQIQDEQAAEVEAAKQAKEEEFFGKKEETAAEPAVTDQPTPDVPTDATTDEYLNNLFDEALAQLEEGQQETPGEDAIDQQAVEAEKQPKTPRTPSTPKTPKEPGGAELTVQFGKLTVKGLGEAMKGLGELFGGNKLSTFPPGFDEQTYAKAKPHFEAAWAAFKEAGGTLVDLFKWMIRQFGAGIRPYAIQFVKEQGIVQTAPEAEKPANAPVNELVPFTTIAGFVRHNLTTGFTWQDLFKRADLAFGGTQAEGRYAVKDAYDAMELGINQYIAETLSSAPLQLTANGAKQVIKGYTDLLKRVPTQSKRTGEQDEFQQFSTPPAYAFLANWAAKLSPNDVYLEPSAGVGGLAVFGKVAGARVVVNELAPRRALLLRSQFDEVYTENAEHIDRILPESVKPTVIVMNPPFSSTAGRMEGRRDTQNATKHIEQALARLEPGGRLVAIVGEGMAADRPAFKQWWAKIQKEYTVRANLGIEGTEYAKYGTTFDNQLLIIDKAGPTIDPVLTGKVASPADAPALLEKVRDLRSLPEATERSGEPAGQREGESAARPEVRDVAGRPGAGAGVGVGGGEPATEPGGGERDGANAPGGAAAAGEATAGSGGAGTVRPGGRNTGRDSGRGESARSGEGSGQPGGAGVTESGNARPGTEIRVEATEAAQRGEFSNAIFEQYVPSKFAIPGAKPHGTPLVESAALATVQPPDPSYTPNLPKDLIESGNLSLAQLEAVAYAGQAHETVMPNGQRRGFFIGDGTGVGKGREISGIVLDNWRRGRTKAIWISEKRGLLKDAQRDWKAIGGDPKVIVPHHGRDKVDEASGILFTTYSLLRSESKSAKNQRKEQGKVRSEYERVQQIVDWVGPDFDGVIAMDESHNMGNVLPIKGKRGMTKPAESAKAALALQRALPKARVIYVSATGATEVHNLAYAERLGLWGEGTSFAQVQNFVSEIGASVSAMELVAQNLKQNGLYIARSLAFEGKDPKDTVTYDRLEHELTGYQRDVYDRLADGWQVVLRNIDSALAAIGATNDEGKPVGTEGKKLKQNIMSKFWGTQQRFFNQVITASSLPSVIEQIEKDLADGRSVVLQVVNTNEADQDRALAKAASTKDEEGGDEVEELDLTPREQLVEMIRSAWPVNQMEEYEDENGVKDLRPVLDSEGKPVVNKEAERQRDKLIEDISKMDIPAAPLQMLIDHFGLDQFAEVTGRKQQLAMDENGKYKIHKRTGSSRDADAQSFIDGKKRILLFSNAGGTGFSFHSDLGYKNQEQRAHYILQAGWSANKAIQGLGRTHRTNQASAPIYRLVTTDITAQKRFTSSIARRLEQLGALTRGQRDSASGSIFSAADNLESIYAGYAMEEFFKNVTASTRPIAYEDVDPQELLHQLGFSKLLEEDTGRSKGKSNIPEVTQFLNRLLSLKLDMQTKVFNLFMMELEQQIEAAKAKGAYDDGLKTIKHVGAKTAARNEVYKDEGTKAVTEHIEFEVHRPNRIYDFEEADAMTRGDRGAWFVNAKSGRVAAIWKMGTTMTDPRTGRIEPRYGVYRTSGISYLPESKVLHGESWDRQDQAKARELWEAENAERPKTLVSNVHMIVGNILPIWNRFPNKTVDLARLRTDDGERFLGRVIAEKDIETTLANLNTKTAAASMKGADVVKKVMAGNIVTFSNGWRMKKVRVSGDNRIELEGVGYMGSQALRDMLARGVIEERIDWAQRFFIPTGEKGGTVIDDLMKLRNANVTRVVPPEEEGEAKLHAAYHGAREDFDTFSTEFIGSGEGTQAFGWGLYFASRKEVAEFYRDQYSSGVFQFEGRTVPRAEFPAYLERWAANKGRKDGRELAEAARLLGRQGGNYMRAGRGQTGAVLKALQFLQGKATFKSAGKLYHVELLPKEDEYLDWDKPLSQQSEYVKARLPEDYADDMTGMEFYKELANSLLEAHAATFGTDETIDPQELASSHLFSKGIPGIRFLDGTSRVRRGPEAHHNYVIFDDSLVSITAKFARRGRGGYSQGGERGETTERRRAPAPGAEAQRQSLEPNPAAVGALESVLRRQAGLDEPLGLRARRAETIAQIAAVRAANFFGAKLAYFENPRPDLLDVHGVYVKNASNPALRDTIFVAADNPHPHLQVLGHELTHRMRTEAPDLYDGLKDALLPMIRNLDGFKQLYGLDEVGMSEEDVIEELIGDLVGDRFMERQFWGELAKRQPTLFQKIADYVLRFLGLLTGRSFGSVRFVNDINAARAAITETMAEYASRKQGERPAPTGGERAVFHVPHVNAGFTLGMSWNDLTGRVRNEANNHFESSRTFNRWWHRTVGTQYHKAQVDRDFKPVFDRGQDFLNDTTRFAMEAEAQAPDLLLRMETVRDVFRRGAKDEDVAKVATALYDGTLLGEGDPMRGIVWDDDRLRDQFDLNDKQIGLYHQARAAIDNSLDNLAKSVITRLARNIGLDSDPEFGIDDLAEDIRQKIDEKAGLIQDRLALMESADFEPGDTGDMEPGAYIAKEIREAKEEIATLDKTLRSIQEVDRKNAALKEHGYFPLMRFGTYTVNIKDAEGKELFFGLFETQAEANEAAKVLAEDEEFRDAEITKGVLSERGYQLFGGVTPETVAVFAAQLGLEQDPLMQDYLRLAVSNRSAMKRLIHRKGTKGYSQDMRRTLASFVTSNARAASSNYHLGEMTKAIQAIPKEKGDVKDEAIDLYKYLTQPQEEAAKLRGYLFVNFIGGSIASALVNATQPVTMTLPYLAQYVGAAKAGTLLTQAGVEAATGKPSRDVRAAYEKALEEGIIAPHEIYQLMAQARGQSGVGGAWQRFTKAWGGFFSLAEAFNRRVSFIAAYRVAKGRGDSDRAAYEFAKQAVVDTQGLYNRGNRPNWARGAVGSTVFTFKQFSIAYIEFLKRLPRQQQLLALGILILASGLQGVPFADDLDDLIDTLGQWMGFNTNTKRWKRQLAEQVFGQYGAQYVLHGVSPALPFDVSLRMGLGNLIPGTGAFKKSETNPTRDFAEVLGPVGGLATSAIQGMERAAKGDAYGAAKAVLPTALRNMLQAGEMAGTGEVRDSRGRTITREVTLLDAFSKFLGFNPNVVAEESRRLSESYADVQLNRVTEAEIAERWARGIVDNDEDAIARARRDLAVWNRNNPDQPIVLTPRQIVQRVRAYRSTREERFTKSAPRELRPGLASS